MLQAGPESDLDFQISYPLIYPRNSILFQADDPVYEANYTYEGFLNNFLDAIDGSYCSTISPLDPPYPDPSNAAGAYKGKLQCGVCKLVSKFSFRITKSNANMGRRQTSSQSLMVDKKQIFQRATKLVNVTNL